MLSSVAKNEERSMFPPDKIAPTFLFLNLSSFKIAARTVALDSSIISLVLSKNNFAADIIYSYVTKMIS